MSSRSSSSNDPKEYAASKPLRPERHKAQRPSSSRGLRLRKGVRQQIQKNSALTGRVFSRHALQTGIRLTSLSEASQILHSSGKTREKTKEGIRAIRERLGSASALMSQLLLKAHLLRCQSLLEHKNGTMFLFQCTPSPEIAGNSLRENTRSSHGRTMGPAWEGNLCLPGSR